MTVVRLVALAAGHARRRWPVAAVAVVVAALVAGTAGTLVGGAVRRNHDLLDTLRTPTARSITVRSGPSAAGRLDHDAVEAIASLPGVERAVAFSTVASASTGPVDDPSVTVGFFDVATLNGPTPFELMDGRLPEAGEVIASGPAADRLRLSGPAGSLTVGGDVLSVVGRYSVPELGAISDLLAESAITPAPDDGAGFVTVVMLTREPADVPVVVGAVSRLLAPFGPDYFTVEFDERAAGVQATVAASGNEGARSIAFVVIAGGAVIAAAMGFLTALLQRRDNARRRAFGFQRRQVVALTVIEAVGLASLGALLGATGAFAVVRLQGGQPDAGQLVATACFVVVVSAVASVPGGLTSAVQDPARILRVP